jgi:histidinol-phosphate aminotransferase
MEARAHLEIIRVQRARMREALRMAPGVREVLPSWANFLAVRFDNAGAIHQCLLAAGIVVRDIRRYPNLGDALRITVGTPEENDKVLAILENAATDGQGLVGGSA